MGPAGSPGHAWGTGCSLPQMVPWVPVLKGQTQAPGSATQEKEPHLGFLQGPRYFAPGKRCHIFPDTDKVKPLIWLKI